MLRRKLPVGPSRLVETLWSFRDSILNKQYSCNTNTELGNNDCTTARKRSTSAVCSSNLTLNQQSILVYNDITAYSDNDISMGSDTSDDQQEKFDNKRLRLSNAPLHSYVVNQAVTSRKIPKRERKPSIHFGGPCHRDHDNPNDFHLLQFILGMIHRKRSIRMSTLSNEQTANGHRKIKKVIPTLHYCTVDRCFAVYIQNTVNTINRRAMNNPDFIRASCRFVSGERTNRSTCAIVSYIPTFNSDYLLSGRSLQQEQYLNGANFQQYYGDDIDNIDMSNEVADYVMSEQDTLFWEVPSNSLNTSFYTANTSSHGDEQPRFMDISRNTISKNSLGRRPYNQTCNLSMMQNSESRKCQDYHFNRWCNNEYSRSFPNALDNFGSGFSQQQINSGAIITGKSIFAEEEIYCGSYRPNTHSGCQSENREHFNCCCCLTDDHSCNQSCKKAVTFHEEIDDMNLVALEVDLLNAGGNAEFSNEELEELLSNYDSNSYSHKNITGANSEEQHSKNAGNEEACADGFRSTSSSGDTNDGEEANKSLLRSSVNDLTRLIGIA